MQVAIQQLNYDISLVVVEDNKVHPWHWLHGVEHLSNLDSSVDSRVDSHATEQLPTNSEAQDLPVSMSYRELELLTSLNGPTKQIVRMGDMITYLGFGQQPYSVKASLSHSPLPDILRTDLQQVGANYEFTSVGKSRVAGFKAQLIRIVARDNTRYSTWIWLHEESALPLKMAIVSSKGEVLRQVQVTSFVVSQDVDPVINELAAMELPTQNLVQVQQNISDFDWQLRWVPRGFVPTKLNRHRLMGDREWVDYVMLSDGLVWFSVYIRDLGQVTDANGHSTYLSSGAETYITEVVGQFEVTVIGAIPMVTAKKLAQSITQR
nr:MucB/RseB C-terminal domain-containing protein [Saccharobesus litoralis]